jgi:hypothetical protein
MWSLLVVATCLGKYHSNHILIDLDVLDEVGLEAHHYIHKPYRERVKVWALLEIYS